MAAPGPSRRTCAIAVSMLIALHLALVVQTGAHVAWTSDELNYLGAGHALWNDFGFVTPVERFQGPLPLLANHLFVDASKQLDPDAVRGSARLGMLVFSLLLLGGVAGFARELWGRRGMLVALALAALSPALIGYGALLAVDVAFASFSTLALWCTWRLLARHGAKRALLCGAVTGAMLATKYLAVLLVPCIALAAVVAGWRHARLRGAAGTLVLVGLGAWIGLQCCYGLVTPGFADLASLRSGPFQAAAKLPLVPGLLRLLPSPFVQGIDYQLAAAGSYSGTFLGHRGGHPAYFVVSLLTKTPLPELFLLAVACAVRVPRVRGVRLAIGLPILVMLGYLSLSRMQLGIRYVLPVVPLLQVLAGRIGASRFAAGRIGAATVGAALLLSLGDRLIDHPHHLSFFNALVGREGGMAVFGDSNCDWGQDREQGRRVLAERWPGIEFLDHDDSPRFGLVAVHVAARHRQPDAAHAGWSNDWLDRFAPIDHYLAAWSVYRVDPTDFEDAIAHGDQHAARDLVLAHLRADDVAAARAVLPRVLPVSWQAGLSAVADGLEAVRAHPDDPAVLVPSIQALMSFGLMAPAARAAMRLPAAQDLLRWQLLMSMGEMPTVYDRLRAAKRDRPLGFEERFLLAQCAYWSGDHAIAVAELAAEPQPEPGPLATNWTTLRGEAETEALHSRRLFGR